MKDKDYIGDFVRKVVECDNFCECPMQCKYIKECQRTNPCKDIAKWQCTNGYADMANRHVPEPFNGNPETAKIVFISSNPSVRHKENTPRIGDNCYDFFVHRFDEPDESKKYVRHDKQFKYYALEKNNRGKNCGRAVKYWTNAAKIAQMIKGVGLNKCLLTEVVKCKTRSEDRKIVTDEVAKECMKKHFRNFLDMLSFVNKNEDKNIIFVVVGTLARNQINEWIKAEQEELKKQKEPNKELKEVSKEDELVEWKWRGLIIKLFCIRHLSWQGFEIYAEFDEENEKFRGYTPIVIPPNISVKTLEELRKPSD